ncbi:mannan endo-1,4-beta-mannosidase [Kaistella treverensis]|uniref:mannan endo-1,4-beta-mannosidase n=2 Tax=Kaistella treverensis TaxID=631455 RepID=A0A1I3LHD2_9FLAO|nr:mannan endo-1,4-beta-mannosidase [Kaistella treverensis]
MARMFSKLMFALLVLISSGISAQKFVSVENGQFILNNKPYYFVGTNFWYASYLGLESDDKRGINRLKSELSFLKSQNVTNIRVLVGVEGTGKINGNNRVEPAYQYEAGKFNEENLKGLDILMNEAAKQDIKVVLFLSNNWEWSGGWLQYLNWNGKIDDETLQNPFNWDDWRDYTSKFYSCNECQKQYFEQVRRIITRKNAVNGKKYTRDKTLMAWEIANEPRPMRPYANENYKKFLAKSSAFIKSLDRNHLVTTGSEGEMGTENMDLFKQTHQDPNIDYLTIHIWPKNWGWFDKNKMEEGFENARQKSIDYIEKHLKIADEINKPMVLEEFGFPRDHHSFDIHSSTNLRDRYFETALKLWHNSKNKNGRFAGVAFWAFGGEAKPIPGQVFWKKGDDFMGDPPMEEQGLNSVFVSDQSTWEIIRKFSKSE